MTKLSAQTMPDMLNTLIIAIQNRKEIGFTYSGIDRVGQPVAVGVSNSGHEVIRIYQTEGEHIHPNHLWDLCDLHELSNLYITNKEFSRNPPGYKKGDRGMSQIYAEL